jgi:hypothetical protein
MWSPEWLRRARVVDDSSGCWEWQLAKTPNGYGIISVKRAGKRTSIGAHRASFQRFVRMLKPGEFVLHSCDNPGCINPEHLRAGTPLENMQDKMLRGHAYQGAEHHRAKLSESDVREIRRRYDAGERVSDIRKDYPRLAWTNIRRVAIRSTWKHVA